MSGEENTPDGDGDMTFTTDPNVAREMLEVYDGYPAHRQGSEGDGDQGLLRIGFTDDSDEDADLKPISWESFAEEFEEKGLKLVYPSSLPEDGFEEIRLVEHNAK